MSLSTSGMQSLRFLDPSAMSSSNIQSSDFAGNTPLIVAAGSGLEQVVRRQLKQGAAVNASNKFGTTALMEACRQGNVSIVKLLLQNNADVRAVNEIGASALLLAIAKGDEAVVRVLLDNGAEVSAEVDASDCTGALATSRSGNTVSALMMACKEGNSSLVDLLLRRGAALDQRLGATAWTPLMVAALYGHTGVCQMLVQQGADAEMTNVCDCTALDIAIASNHGRTQRLLEQYVSHPPKEAARHYDSEDVFEAAKAGQHEAVLDILERDGRQASVCDERGATPLMVAAMHGFLQVTETLVNAGADVDAQDLISGWTALMQATYHGHSGVASYLVQCGADATMQAKEGLTAVKLATILGRTYLAQLFAKPRSAVAAKDDFGKRRPPRRQPSNSNQQTSPGRQFDSRDLLPDFLDIEEDGKSANSFKKWLSNITSKFKKATSNKIIDVAMISPSAAGTPFPAADRQPLVNRWKPGNLQRQVSLPWGDQDSKSKGPMQEECIADSNALEPSSSSAIANRPDRNVAGVADSTSVSKQDTGAVPADVRSTIVPPFYYKAIDHRASSAGGQSQQHQGASPADLPSSSYPSNERAPVQVYRGVSSSSLNSSGGSVSRQPSMVRPSRRQSCGSFAMSTAGNQQVTTSQREELATKKPPVQDTQESGRLLTAGTNEHSHTHTSKPTARSLDLLPQPAPNRQFKKSRFAAPQSPHTPTSGIAVTSPGWLSHGQVLLSAPVQNTPHHAVASSAPSQASSEGTGSTISVDKQLTYDAFGQLLQQLKLTKYYGVFEEQEVDLETFLTLTDGDLRELGIESRHERQQILQGIEDARKQT